MLQEVMNGEDEDEDSEEEESRPVYPVSDNSEEYD